MAPTIRISLHFLIFMATGTTFPKSIPWTICSSSTRASIRITFPSWVFDFLAIIATILLTTMFTISVFITATSHTITRVFFLWFRGWPSFATTPSLRAIPLQWIIYRPAKFAFVITTIGTTSSTTRVPIEITILIIWGWIFCSRAIASRNIGWWPLISILCPTWWRINKFLRTLI